MLISRHKLPISKLCQVLVLAALSIVLQACGGGFRAVPSPADAQTQAASVVSQYSGTLNAVIDPLGNDVTVWFEWGTSSAFGKKTTPMLLGGSEHAVNISHSFTDELSADTEYFYRIVAENETEIRYGKTLSFRTTPIPLPFVQTIASADQLNAKTQPASVNDQGCGFHAVINPNGFPTEAWFEWGADDSYGQFTSIQGAGEGKTNVGIKESIDNHDLVSPGAVYHYRIVARIKNIPELISYGEDAVCTSSSSPVDSDGDGLSDKEEKNLFNTNPKNPDSDADGLNDGEEVKIHFTNPNVVDSDSDGLTDGDEINLFFTSPIEKDTDHDGLTDSAELNIHATAPTNADTDGDTLSDGDEINTLGTDALKRDSDGDGINDGVEVNDYGTDPMLIDTDGDTVSDNEEIVLYNTNPLVADTDRDNLGDGLEIMTYHTDPLIADTDKDGLNDGYEINFSRTNPLNRDGDADGLTDGDEVNVYHTSPFNIDTDNDELSDSDEINIYQTDPLNPDTDGDGLVDGREIRFNTNPLVFDVVDYFPDLLVTEVSAPRGALKGSQLTVDFVITNSSVQDAGSFITGVYLSEDQVIDKRDLLVSEASINQVPGGQTQSIQAQFTVPDYIVEGIYFLGIVADNHDDIVENDETNNSSAVELNIGAIPVDTGDGSDGAAMVSGTINLTTDSVGAATDKNATLPDGFATALTGNAIAGSASIQVQSTAGFVSGDEILIIQMVHNTNHGVYEFVKNITVSDATTIGFTRKLRNDYFASTTAKSQVVRVPQYANFYIPAGSVITASAFDRATGVGGIITFRANGILTIDGSINMTGKGFAGGASRKQGYSYTEQLSQMLMDANGGGGGGGQGGLWGPGDLGSGGGGGHRIIGGSGADGILSHGYDGGIYGDAKFTTIHLGSGGGGGNGIVGNPGGGIIHISADMIFGSGHVEANGIDGTWTTVVPYNRSYWVGGGGGAGGIVYVATNSTNMLATQVTANGGAEVAVKRCTKVRSDGCRRYATLVEGYRGGDGWKQLYVPRYLPDLVVNSVLSPVTAIVDNTITVLNSISNVIDNSTVNNPFKVGFYLSQDQTITTTDLLLGERLVSVLPGGATNTVLTDLPMNVLPDYYRYRKSITISAANVNSAVDLGDFPLLVSVTDTDLINVTNGGKVQSIDGNDIVFRASDGLTLLDYEIEHYDPLAGQLVAWVRLPMLSALVDTKIYIYYGNSAASTSSQNAAAVWDAGYQMVHHLNETAGTHFDSTANANDVNPFGAVNQAAAGQIGGANYFDGIDDLLLSNQSVLNYATSDWTINAWVQVETPGVNPIVQTQDDTGSLISGRSLLYVGSDNTACTFTTTALCSSQSITTGINNWHQLTVVHNNAANTVTWYIDGKAISTSFNAIFDSNTGQWRIGAQKDNLYFFGGGIDEVRVSNIQRTSDYLKVTFDNQKMPGTFITVGAEELLGSGFSETWYLGVLVDNASVIPELNEGNNLSSPNKIIITSP